MSSARFLPENTLVPIDSEGAVTNNSASSPCWNGTALSQVYANVISPAETLFPEESSREVTELEKKGLQRHLTQQGVAGTLTQETSLSAVIKSAIDLCYEDIFTALDINEIPEGQLHPSPRDHTMSKGELYLKEQGKTCADMLRFNRAIYDAARAAPDEERILDEIVDDTGHKMGELYQNARVLRRAALAKMSDGSKGSHHGSEH